MTSPRRCVVNVELDLELEEADQALRDEWSRLVQTLLPAIVETIMVAALPGRCGDCEANCNITTTGGRAVNSVIRCSFQTTPQPDRGSDQRRR